MHRAGFPMHAALARYEPCRTDAEFGSSIRNQRPLPRSIPRLVITLDRLDFKRRFAGSNGLSTTTYSCSPCATPGEGRAAGDNPSNGIPTTCDSECLLVFLPSGALASRPPRSRRNLPPALTFAGTIGSLIHLAEPLRHATLPPAPPLLLISSLRSQSLRPSIPLPCKRSRGVACITMHTARGVATTLMFTLTSRAGPW